MAKGRAYDDLYARLETKEGEKELYKLARQRDRAGKDVQHMRVIKDENGNVIVNSIYYRTCQGHVYPISDYLELR